MPTTITNDAWEMLTSFRKPSWIAPGQACRVLALPPKAPPFPMRAPHVGTGTMQFSSPKGNVEWMTGVSGPQSPCLCQEEGPGGGGSTGIRGTGASVPAGLASRSCWRCHGYRASISLPPTPPASPSPSDQALPGTEAPGCHGNGFQAPAAGVLIGWLRLQAKVSPRVTARGWNWVSSRFQAREGDVACEILIHSSLPLGLLRVSGATWVGLGPLAPPC